MDSELVIDLRDGIDTERKPISMRPVSAGGERSCDAQSIVEQIDWVYQAGYVDAAVVLSDNLLARFGNPEDSDRLRRLVPFVSDSTEVEITTETRHYRARNSGDHTIVLRIAERRRSEEMVEMLMQGLLRREIHAKGARP